MACLPLRLAVLAVLPVRMGLAVTLADPSPAAPAAWRVEAELTGFHETFTTEETTAYCKRLAQASSQVAYRSLGRSPEGREMPCLIVSRDGVTSPGQVDRRRRAVVLVHDCIHPGEVEGKDASLMLVRDMAIAPAPRSALLDGVVLVVVPLFNIDGHSRFGPHNRINQNGPAEMGWRVTSTNLNLNRDFMKADAPEMRATLALFTEWDPDFHVDNHTSDGGDWQYDLTFDIAHQDDVAAPLRAWVKDSLIPHVVPALEADGHVVMRYFDFADGKDPSKGISSGSLSPRFSTGYGALRHCPSLLVETHMLKDYRTRVIGTYNVMRHALERVSSDLLALRAARAAAEAEAVEAGLRYDPARTWPLALESDPSASEEVAFRGFAWDVKLSDVSGDAWISYDTTRPIEVPLKYQGKSKVRAAAAPPLAYLVPPQWTEVTSRLRAHGLRLDALQRPLSGPFESYRLRDAQLPGKLFEGRLQVPFRAELVVEERTLPAGSVVVRLDQPLARVAFHLLEPGAADSLAAWGFFNAVLEQKELAEPYVMEAVARDMMAEDPALRQELMKRVASDAAFAGSPSTRLDFFYRRSPWWDDAMERYPVVRVTRPLDPSAYRPSP